MELEKELDDSNSDYRVAFLDEELDSLLVRHLAGVHLDSDYVSRVAQERVLQLSELAEPERKPAPEA